MSRRLRDPRFLISSWPLNGHADNISGYGNNGVWTGTEAYNPFLKNSRSAADFNESSLITVAPPTFPVGAADKFTIAFWAFLRDLGQGGIGRVYQSAAFRVYGSAPNVWAWRTGTIITENNAYDFYNWFHTVIVADGVNVTSYINGVWNKSTSQVALSLGVDATIGGGTRFLDGRIADLRLYNIALTNDEVITLMRMPQPTY